MNQGGCHARPLTLLKFAVPLPILRGALFCAPIPFHSYYSFIGFHCFASACHHVGCPLALTDAVSQLSNAGRLQLMLTLCCIPSDLLDETNQSAGVVLPNVYDIFAFQTNKV